MGGVTVIENRSNRFAGENVKCTGDETLESTGILNHRKVMQSISDNAFDTSRGMQLLRY